jgi:predicted MPP superfamily phosphohydrolase
MGALSPSGDLGVARVRAALALLAAGVAGAVGMRSALTPPAVRRIEIGVRSWPAALDGLRIVQVSDVHIGPILGRRFAEQVTERVRALAPDLIAVTGDLVDGSVDLLREEVAPFAKLSAPLGAFFVLGNHDCYSGATAWAGHVRELGMDVLRNQHRVIERSGARFVLAGVDDHHAAWVPGAGREDLEAALADAPVGLPVVLLAHDPSTFKRASARVDLQLSGHTHAGQIWPFRYLVRLAVPFVEGLYERTGARLYVSRGTGFWGPPMRLLAPAEITEIVLRSSGTPSPESTSPESQSVC